MEKNLKEKRRKRRKKERREGRKGGGRKYQKIFKKNKEGLKIMFRN